MNKCMYGEARRDLFYQCDSLTDAYIQTDFELRGNVQISPNIFVLVVLVLPNLSAETVRSPNSLVFYSAAGGLESIPSCLATGSVHPGQMIYWELNFKLQEETIQTLNDMI